METALRKAGVKAFNKATASQRRLVTDVPRQQVVATLGRTVLAALSLTEDDLLANAVDDLLPIVAGYITAAQAEAVAVLATVDPAAALDSHATEWAAIALATLSEGFLAAARVALHDPDPHLSPLGEMPMNPTKLPVKVVSDAVARAGGAQPMGPDAVLLGGPGTGAPLQAVIAAVPTKPKLVYVWHWGYHGTPARPFPPHQSLDGQRFASIDDKRLLKDPLDPETSWLGGTIFHVGDHKNCSCALLLQIDEGTK
jgi:hypothetical protein